MGDGRISQEELDKLFGVNGGLEEIIDIPKHIWIIKDLTNRAVCGGRCMSYLEAQRLLNTVMQQYPENKFEIKQVR